MSARSRAMLLRGVENLLIIGFVAMIAMVFGNVVLRYIFNSGNHNREKWVSNFRHNNTNVVTLTAQ